MYILIRYMAGVCLTPTPYFLAKVSNPGNNKKTGTTIKAEQQINRGDLKIDKNQLKSSLSRINFIY